MKRKLTERQREIYEFIVGMIKEKGYPPTIREIGERFSISSTNGVRTNLNALVRKGYIQRKAFLSRGIELVGPAKSVGIYSEVKEVPIIGRVAAGEPILATENIEGSLAVSQEFLPPGEMFALRVRGDSMRDAGIFDNDYVIARHQPYADRGDIVVAVIDDEATVKKYHPRGKWVRLLPENNTYDPIVIDATYPGFRLAGKVIGLFRKI